LPAASAIPAIFWISLPDDNSGLDFDFDLDALVVLDLGVLVFGGMDENSE
jgi:hypothetical protein